MTNADDPNHSCSRPLLPTSAPDGRGRAFMVARRCPFTDYLRRVSKHPPPTTLASYLAAARWRQLCATVHSFIVTPSGFAKMDGTMTEMAAPSMPLPPPDESRRAGNVAALSEDGNGRKATDRGRTVLGFEVSDRSSSHVPVANRFVRVAQPRGSPWISRPFCCVEGSQFSKNIVLRQ